MKKVIIFVMIIMLACPVASAEFAMDNHPDEFIGCWAVFLPASHTGVGDMSIIIVMNGDGTLNFILSTDNASEKQTIVQIDSGKWTVMYDTVIYQRDGKDTYGKIEYRDNKLWFTFNGATFGLTKHQGADITDVIYPDMSDK